jgi:hypothetical protein
MMQDGPKIRAIKIKGLCPHIGMLPAFDCSTSVWIGPDMLRTGIMAALDNDPIERRKCKHYFGQELKNQGPSPTNPNILALSWLYISGLSLRSNPPGWTTKKNPRDVYARILNTTYKQSIPQSSPLPLSPHFSKSPAPYSPI